MRPSNNINRITTFINTNRIYTLTTFKSISVNSEYIKMPKLQRWDSYLERHQLYRRELLGDGHVRVYCTQIACVKIYDLPKGLHKPNSTNKFVQHYQSKHPTIPTSEKVANARNFTVEDTSHSTTSSQASQGASQSTLFHFSSAFNTQFNELRYRRLIVNFIAQNQLAMSVVDSSSYRELTTFLNA